MTKFTVYPNFLTLWSKQQSNYTQLTGSAILRLNNPNLTYKAMFTIVPKGIIDVYEIHHETIIHRLSAWCGLLVFIVLICVICYLGCVQREYNKNMQKGNGVN